MRCLLLTLLLLNTVMPVQAGEEKRCQKCGKNNCLHLSIDYIEILIQNNEHQLAQLNPDDDGYEALLQETVQLQQQIYILQQQELQMGLPQKLVFGHCIL